MNADSDTEPSRSDSEGEVGSKELEASHGNGKGMAGVSGSLLEDHNQPCKPFYT